MGPSPPLSHHHPWPPSRSSMSQPGVLRQSRVQEGCPSVEVSTFASSTQSHTSAHLTTNTSGQATGSLLSWGGFLCPRMGTISPPHHPRGALSAPLRRHIPPPAPQKRSS